MPGLWQTMLEMNMQELRTSRPMSAIAILSSVRAVFEERAAMVEVEAFHFLEKSSEPREGILLSTALPCLLNIN